MMFPAVIERILSHLVNGLDGYAEMMQMLIDPEPLKVFVNVAAD